MIGLWIAIVQMRLLEVVGGEFYYIVFYERINRY